MENKRKTVLKLNNISKSFGGVHALTDVSFELKEGSVLSIVGENGAGKSTMVKIISGVLKPDDGEIYYNGRLVNFDNPDTAKEAGIAIVFQEPNIFGDMSVLENLFIFNEPKTKFGTIDWKKMHSQGIGALKLVGLTEEILSKNMNELSVGNQQLILIAKGVFAESKVLILDEPTSILSHSETVRLFDIVKSLKKMGTSIIYISHRMEEIFEISDDIIVLRDGHLTAACGINEADDKSILKLMSGRHINTDVFNERF